MAAHPILAGQADSVLVMGLSQGPLFAEVAAIVVCNPIAHGNGDGVIILSAMAQATEPAKGEWRRQPDFVRLRMAARP